MLPRWHILFGFILSLFIYLVWPQTTLLNATLFFLASFLIDFDHYMSAVYNSGKLGLFASFDYYKKLDAKMNAEKKRGIRRRGDFHVFHTVEFHLLVLLIGLYVEPILWVFFGMLFHSLTDVVSISLENALYMREFWLIAWIARTLRTR